MSTPTATDIANAKAVLAAAETQAAAVVSTVGQAIDKDVAALKARVAALETSVSTWVKANWPHFLTWGASALTALKIFGKL